MSSFELAFPGYVGACVLLFRDLLPFAFFLLVFGVALEFWHEPATPEAILKTFIRVFLILLLLLQSSELINGGQTLIKEWVEHNIPARPENVAQRYQERLREAQQLRDDADVSFVHQVLNGDFYEAIILAVLMLVSWFAMAVLAFVYNVQRVLLLGAWALSPLLIPCLAVRPIAAIGLQHVLRLVAIMLWPIGLALAATFTEGLIEVISSGTSFNNASFGEAVGKGLTGLLGIAVLAVWIILSTVLAPLYIQRLITGTGGPVSIVMRALALSGSGLASTISSARSHLNTGSSSAPNGARTDQGVPKSPARVDTSPAAVQPPPPPVAPSLPSPSAEPTGDQAAQSVKNRFKKNRP